MKEKILITSALPYANGPLHFGHIAGAYLPGDCYARYQRLKQRDVLYICGSDEYGVAITLSAEVAGCSPREHVDRYHAMITDFFDRLSLSFDHYSRTTSPYHAEPVQSFFLDLQANGYIEERVTEQLYSEADGRFLADRYVVGTCPGCGYERARGDECPKCGGSFEATDLHNPRSRLTHAPLTRKKTKHWYLLLEKFQEQLLQWLAEKQWKPNVTQFVKKYVEGIKARAITRDSDWGVPLPIADADGKVLYVWFDAPIGYLSATMEWAAEQGEPDLWKKYWCDSDTHLVQFVGKDNIPFHAVIFPAMVMGQNLPLKLVDELPANEFYNLEGRQFSKSEGWYIDLESFFEHYSADQIRYAIASNAPETQDAEFTWKDFQQRCNSELLGKYGNLVNRVLVFAHKKCGGKVPPMAVLTEIDRAFLEAIRTLAEQLAECFEQFKLRRASHLVMELAQQGNIYFNDKQPWKEETQAGIDTTIACSLECLKLLALVSSPIIPSTAEQVWQQLGNGSTLTALSWDHVVAASLPTGQKLLKPTILFRKVEDEQIANEIDKLNAKEPATMSYTPLKDSVDITDFQKVDLRVGQVLEAEPIPKSKKLLKLKVDIGIEVRTIVAGIKLSYSPEALIGKKVVVIANLKPVTIMSVESQGMLLAGNHDDTLELATTLTQSLPPGSVVR